MFLALRDLRHAPGRFTLIGAVIALMMLLVGFLTGLTGGLAGQNISGILSTGASSVVAATPDDGEFSWSTAQVDDAQVTAWQDAAAGTDATVTPVGVSTTRLEAGDASAAVTLWAEPSGDGVATGDIVLPVEAADQLGLAVGDQLELAGNALTVTEIADTGQFSHTDLARVSLDDWRDYLAATMQPERAASVLLIDGDLADADALAAQTGTQQASLLESLLGLEAFKSEIGTLGLMIGMLFGISALIVGVFFLVWSMQRQRDISVLKALGAPSGWLRRDALGQALLLLVVAIAVGSGLARGRGALIAPVAPFVVAWWTILPPAIAMLAAGLIGALVSLRQINRVDPLVALNASAA
jgi:putative ABC transport system permease protein